jgi:hypothetical protein
MEIRIGSKDGQSVTSVGDMVWQIATEIESAQEQWQEQLAGSPQSLGEIERSIQQKFSRLGAQLLVALLAQTSRQ